MFLMGTMKVNYCISIIPLISRLSGIAMGLPVATGTGDLSTGVWALSGLAIICFSGFTASILLSPPAMSIGTVACLTGK